ncbi:MAG: uracil-DNA glycosylase [Deltaproteobacteria bacterium]|nr:uracil-DNA glycosylase [Deltaproteobacteria bacterium]
MEPDATKLVRAYLEREMALGLDAVPGAAAAQRRGPAARAAHASTPAAGVGASALPVGRAASPEPRPGRPAEGVPSALSHLLVEPAICAASSLEELRNVLGDCRRCKLCSGRKNIVFGVGDPRAEVMFVGEGPGEDEDLQGKPFVGKAGALLDRIITGGMGLGRDRVYIANVVKCRPPNNRNPEPDEIVACEPFLRRQIELVAPRVVISLGAFATQVLLRDRTPISRRRGQWHQLDGIGTSGPVALMPTFHPAYLLRTPGDKRLVWEDIKLVMARLGLEMPKRGTSA